MTWRDFGLEHPVYILQKQDVPVQSHVTTDGQSISMSCCLVHSALRGFIRMNFNPTSGLVNLGEIFNVTIGRAACKACSATWNFGTNSAYRSRSYFTTDGRSVSQSVCLGIEHLLGLTTRYYFLSDCCCLKFAVLFLLSALSDERKGL
jgi:hypothetical protein